MTSSTSGRELWVGPNEQYTTLKSAISDSQSGDTVFVRAGVYQNDYATIQHDISIIGVGGKAHFTSTERITNGKAILITNADTVIENLEFSGAFVSDNNGAGIRQQVGNLTIRDSYFHDNEMGILSAADPTSVIRIENTTFDRNGNGTNFSHQVYVNKIASLEVTDSTFTESLDVTDIQSRAANTTVTNSTFDDTEGRASYLINLPNAGNAVITGNTLINGANAGNTKLINYGSAAELNPGSLVVEGNIFINNLDSPHPVFGVNNSSTQEVLISNNTFSGFDDIAKGPATLLGNTLQTTDILGTGGNDKLTGTAGAEIIDGLGGNDVLKGLDGNDRLIGGAGDDRLTGGNGADALFGGDGNDRFYVDEFDTQIVGGAGTDRLFVKSAAGVSADLSASSIEFAKGNIGDDIFNAATANAKTTAYGNYGNDTLTGGSGGDRLYGDAGDDLVIGNAGNDFLYGGNGADILLGGAGNDSLYVDALDSTINGGSGTDKLIVQDGTAVNFDLSATSIEFAVGNAGADVFDGSNTLAKITAFGRDGEDTLTGGAGDDLLKGDNGHDILVGNAGNDRLYGGAGADTLLGGSGNDRLYADALDTSIDGGDGFDRLYVAGPDGVDLNLLSASIEYVSGNIGDDTFNAADTTNKVTLYGQGGDDQLIGGIGDDLLKGGDGNDTLVGGSGSNKLYGGAGDDLFVAQDTGFGRIYGDAGFDTLRFDGANQAFDLTTLASNRLNALEAFDISGSGANTLVLDAATVLSATQGINEKTGTANSLIIDGDAGDTVTTDTGWVDAGSATIDGTGYSVYESAAGGAQIYVDSNVTVDVA